MRLKQTLREQGLETRRVDYEDRTEYVSDFGSRDGVSVDVVGDTAIVVAGEEQHDVELPADARVFLNNDVLTIEVNK
ncbi:hypothetical protein SAMN05216226_10635 [Halovenus aranensis]|jgi:putative heme iron utilization protein|uniref:Uncharacterized protein n=1 Tax=Halovenus aranensis TaxID=890420 RepID=A0A1G8V937_9EURY|nr:hypothetical protein [Halovenus aranensis]SDJ61835.1 hypothetical protein SAMN05216226_10635 [Halovenus aranensis]